MSFTTLYVNSANNVKNELFLIADQEKAVHIHYYDNKRLMKMRSGREGKLNYLLFILSVDNNYGLNHLTHNSKNSRKY